MMTSPRPGYAELRGKRVGIAHWARWQSSGGNPREAHCLHVDMQDRRPDLASPSESIQQAVIRSSRYGKTHEGFHAPLDLVDGAARVYDPIIRGESGEDLHGCFLKDYSPSNW